MKAASVKELRVALNDRNHKELVDLCLRLSKFKKDNKELLTYLLFEASDEETYIKNVKATIDEAFDDVNRKSFYYIKKSLRKILRLTKKYIQYSKNKETEVELLLYYCQKLREFKPSINRSKVMRNLYQRQAVLVLNKVNNLHEDLQFDYQAEIEKL